MQTPGADGCTHTARPSDPDKRFMASTDLAADGMDAEVPFPNKSPTIRATPDAKFSQAMCRVLND